MRSRPSDAIWIVSALCAAFALASSVLALHGADKDGVILALKATARLQFLLFWPAYCGGALVLLFGDVFQPIKSHARKLGLAFASSLFVHLGLVAWLCWIGAAPLLRTFIVFGVAATFAYLLALFSIPALHRALGPNLWRVLSAVGMNWIAYAFFADFVHGPLQRGDKHIVEYLPFAVLAVAGPGLRVAAVALRVGRSWRPVSGR